MRTTHTIREDYEWPCATASLLQDHERLEASHDPSEINQPIFALIKARKALGDARLACLRAAQFHTGLVKDRLAEIAAAIATEHLRFPLSVIGQPLAKRSDLAKWAKPAIAPEVMTTTARKRTTKLERFLTPDETNKALNNVVQSMLSNKG